MDICCCESMGCMPIIDRITIASPQPPPRTKKTTEPEGWDGEGGYFCISHHITPHHIASHHIAPHRTTSHRIILNHIKSNKTDWPFHKSD